jgi:predicted RNA-binding protein YlqC (UPF0109 family)
VFSGNLIAKDDWTIVVDGSGSMKGFFQENEIQTYVSQLETKIKAGGYRTSSQMFIHNSKKKFEHGLFPFEPAIKKYGNSTDLNILFDDMLKLDTRAVIVVTDNLMSTPSETGATKQFYERLSSDKVESLYVIPKLFNFKGSKSKKGILVYAILFDPSFKSEFRTVKNFFSSEELLLIKPITEKEIILKSLAKGKNKPNSIIGKGGELIQIRPLIYQIGKKNRIKFNFSLYSNLSHINIAAKSVDGEPVSLGIENLKLLTNNKKVTIKKSGSVTPRLLQGNLENGQTNSNIYVAEIDFIPTLHWGISDAWSMVNFDWSSFSYTNIKMKTSFDIKIDVPSTSLSLSDNFNNRYFTNNPKEAGKIYSDTDILRMINTKNLPIELHIESK